MLERVIVIYLALATVATAAIFPLPLRAGEAIPRDGERLPSEPPAPTPPEPATAPVVASELADDGCVNCDDEAVHELWVEVAGVIQSALDSLSETGSLPEDDEEDDDTLGAKPSPAPPTIGEQLADVAATLSGLPYRWGGISPATGFDCSGLVYYVHRQFGITLGRDASAQYHHGQVVQRADLEPGDIVFFTDTYASGISHDGIYLGGGRFVHAVRPGSGVKITQMGDDYWGPRYVGARRVFNG